MMFTQHMANYQQNIHKYKLLMNWMTDGCMVKILWQFKHANSGYIMREIE